MPDAQPRRPSPDVPPELPRELLSPLVDLLSSIHKLTGSWKDEGGIPPTLYHFTDCNGLVEILSTKTLWATLATSLNDASETRYAISRLLVGVRDNSIPLKNLRSEVLEHVAGERRFRLDMRTYVCSFCGAAEAVHWLHYGKAGTGVAMGFDSIALYKVHQFELYPVIYDTHNQDALLRAVVELVDEAAGKFGHLDDEAVSAMFAELTVGYIRLLVAPRMKDPAFKSENEYRLISTEAWESERVVDETRQTYFRSANGRVQPYKKVEFAALPLRHIELGASSPMEDSEQALTVLMENTLGAVRAVTRSKVLVRP